MSAARSVRIRSLAKVNLDLRVLYKRPDGFHELRTVFQTISLADTIEIGFVPQKRTQVAIAGNVDIPGNLIVKAAEMVLDSARVAGAVTFRLDKKIPMGGGLGGGSSNAAAVLLALPVLIGRDLAADKLHEMAASLGSDVPFFLLGGTALGLGRGTELYPLADLKPASGILIAPGVHLSTADAYRNLAREAQPKLTEGLSSCSINSFRAYVWEIGKSCSAEAGSAFCTNDFESVAFRQFPRLSSIKRKLIKAGAKPALMSGSGSALFGIFPTIEDSNRAMAAFSREKVYPITLVNRKRYQQMWWRQLREHRREQEWPPRSRYAR